MLVTATSLRNAMFASCVFVSAISPAQVSLKQPSYPAHFPYSFSNLVWWDDATLRAELKRKIPSLGDEIAPASEMEARIRETLTALLAAKDVRAEVQSEDPSHTAFNGPRDPGVPAPGILFLINSPKVLISKVAFENLPQEAAGPLEEFAKTSQGKPYSMSADWADVSQIENKLKELGYLQTRVQLQHGPPSKEADHYIVAVDASVEAGQKYHVAIIEADGGPLLNGRDLSAYFGRKSGDVASPNPFGRLEGALRSIYWQHGYADVDFNSEPILDATRGLASYHLKVIPGPLYHLRSLKLNNLSADQQDQFRSGFPIKPGDVYDALAVSTLSHNLAKVAPALAAYGYGWSPKKDKSAQVVDLELGFFKLQ